LPNPKIRRLGGRRFRKSSRAQSDSESVIHPHTAGRPDERAASQSAFPQDARILKGLGNIPRSQRSRVEIVSGVTTRTGVQGRFSRHPWLHAAGGKLVGFRLMDKGVGGSKDQPIGSWLEACARRCCSGLFPHLWPGDSRVARMKMVGKCRKLVSQLMFRGFSAAAKCRPGVWPCACAGIS
jgi:hypothetical protein